MRDKCGKILQIGYGSLAKAGIQVVIMNIVRGLSKDFEFDILLTSKKKGYFDDEFETIGNIYRVVCDVDNFGKLHRFFSYVVRPIRQFIYTYRLIRKNSYDIVHCHSGLEGGPMFLAAKLGGVKCIIAHSHNTASPEKRTIFSRVYRRLNKMIIHMCATIKIGASEEANRYLFGNEENMVIYNPVDLERFQSNNSNHRLQFLDEQKPLVLTNVGRFCYQKNQEFILEIVKFLIEGNKNVCLNLVGFGENETSLNRLIKQHRLDNYVNLIRDDGSINIPNIMSKSDVFVFPSRFEGLGIALIEAQAMNLLCISSDVVPRETDLGLCEYLSLNQSAEQWASKIIEMVNNKNSYVLDREKLNRFGEESVQTVYRELYSQLLDIK